MTTAILRPNAVGDVTDISLVEPSGAHWEAIDEETPDDVSSFVGCAGSTTEYDLYNLPARSVGGIINSIKVYFRCHGTANEAFARAKIKTNGEETQGDEETLGGATWVTYSKQWDTNPITTVAWTWADIDALQIGVQLKRTLDGYYCRCTQVYVEVDYTWARTETYFDAASLGSPYDATVNKPTGTGEGDILFAVMGWLGSGGSKVIDEVPTGWTLLGNSTYGYYTRTLYYKVAGSSEPESYTWSLDGSAAIRIVCSCYTGGDFDGADPVDVVSNTDRTDNDTICRAAEMNVSVANSPLVFFGIVRSTVARTFTKPTAPTTDWVEDDDAGSTTSDHWIEACSMIWSGSGATGNMDATMSVAGANKHAFAVALNPPAAPPTSQPWLILF